MNAEHAGAYALLLPPRVHRGSGMKARLPEAAGGRPGPAGRPGHASFSGPSSRTKAGEKRRGAGTPVSGALGAALAASLLAAAALLLAPGEARAQFCLGATTASNSDVTCSAATYPVSIRSTIQSNANVTVRVPGGTGTGGTATVITGSTFYAGINLLASDNSQTGNYAIEVGTSGAVSIVDDTGSGNASPGIRIRQHGSGTATVDVRSQVTIGTSTSSRMRAHGIYVRSSGSGGAATITNAGTIYASYEGIDIQHDGAATTTVTHSGAIDSLNHGIQAVTDGAGALMVTSSGNITVTNANQQGIRMRAQKNGAMTLTATGGTITTPAQGIYMESQGTGTVTIRGTAASAPTQSGPTITSSASHGIHVHKSGSSATAGDVSITTTGGSITPATTGSFYGIYVQDRSGYSGTVTIDNAADITASQRAIFVSRLGSGAVSVTNRGGTVRSSASSAILAQNAASNNDTVSVSIMGGTVRTTATGVPAVWAGNRGAGDVSVTIAAGDMTTKSAISRNHAGIFAELGSYSGSPQMTIEQNGAILGRKGVHAQAVQHSTDDPVVARQAADQPVIDVDWTGTFSHGDDPDERAMVSQDDNGRFSVTSAANVPAIARAAQASAATGGLYDGAAGIEAQVMDWRAVATQVAQGDDPGAIDRTAQLSAVPTGAIAADNAYVEQFRALFGNQELAIASAIWTAVGGSGATSLADVTDPEIVTYLRVDNAGRRGLLRNLLSQGLSDKEQAVLAALSTGDSAGLTAALNDTEANFSNAYKTAVRALLNRYHVGNIDVAMTGGSIASRGDGIRAYYATPNANNGAISVTVGEGASVTGARAGIWVANAGLDVGADGTAGTDDDILKQSVTVNGMVTGGTDAAVHLVGGGRLTVGETGVLEAGAGRPAILVKDPGRSVIRIDGEVRGSAGADAAVDLSGGGSVTVGLNGRVRANGARHAIRGSDDQAIAVTLVTTGMARYREDAEEAHGRMEGAYRPENVAEVRFGEGRNGVLTGYSLTVPVDAATGMLDTSGLDPRLCSGGQPRGADGECPGTGEPGTGPGTDPGTGPGDPGTGDPSDPGTGDPSDPGTDPGSPGTDTGMGGVRVVFTGEGGDDRRDTDGIGVRARYAMPGDGNGGIEVTVPAGANVTGSETGVYVENAGLGLMLERKYTPGFARGQNPDELVAVTRGEGANAVPLLDQRVTVAGTVTGGTDAAVHLNGGGAVIVMKGGRVLAGSSGIAIKVNDPGPALIYIDGEVRGGVGGAAAVDLPAGGSVIVGLNADVEVNHDAKVIQGGDTAATKPNVVWVIASQNKADVDAAHERVKGPLGGVGAETYREDRNGEPTGYTGEVRRNPDGTADTSRFAGDDPGMTFSCEDVERMGDRRCRLYEALPSMLVAMNALPSYAERTSAARDGNGGWARVEASRGEWQAKTATMETTSTPLAYDHRRNAVRAGVDFHAGESARVGVSVHALGGKAEMSGVGDVELDGMGGGLSATWRAGEFYVDAQAAVTLYDVDVESYTHGKMSKKDVYGAGYGLGVDVGRRMGVGGMMVTPRAGLEWSKVDLDDFVDMERADSPEARARVSVEEAGQREGPRGGDVGGGDGFGRDHGARVRIGGRGAGVLGGDGGDGRGGSAEDGGPSDGGASGARRGVRGGRGRRGAGDGGLSDERQRDERIRRGVGAADAVLGAHCEAGNGSARAGRPARFFVCGKDCQSVVRVAAFSARSGFDRPRSGGYGAPMTKRKLPIGIQTFREIREEGCYYVDKTVYACRLVDEGKHYFLSRPRRFGKSLLVDTLKELFEGNEPLFRGLAVHDRWDWSVRHPVVRLDFSGRNFTESGHLDLNLAAQLDAMERRAGAGTPYPAGPERFSHLLETLHERSGQRVAVLVDEYDKPILDALGTPELARANRDALRGLYSAIKFSDAHVKFTLLTGVSKFSKVGIFSGLNNLIDITLDPRYSAICGYTERDLDSVFAPELPGLDRDEIRRWYNGYGWRGEGEGLQPLRHPAAVPAARVQGALVRDRDAEVPHRHAAAPRRRLSGTGRDDGHRRAAVRLRRGRDGDGGAAVPDRLPDHPGRGGVRRPDPLPAGLSEPRGAPEPERAPVERPVAGVLAAYGGGRAPARAARRERLRGVGGAVPFVLRRHSRTSGT